MTRLILILALAVQSLSAGQYYIDYASGSDANSGTSKATPWKRAPGMAGFSGAYSHNNGDRFIFKGGVSWINSWPMQVLVGGTTGSREYYGTDQTWYSGGSWTRPFWDGGGIQLGSGLYASQVFCSASYVTFDGIDIGNHRSSKGNASYGDMTVSLYGPISGVTVTNCVIRDWSMASPVVSGDDSNGTGGIQYFWGGGAYLSDSIVTHCTLYQHGVGTNYTGVAIRNIAPVEYCEIYDTCNGYLGGGVIRYNHIYNIRQNADPLTHANAIEIFSSAEIYGNKVHDLAGPTGDQVVGPVSPYNLIPDTSTGGRVTTYNNIFYNLGGQTINGDHTGHPELNEFVFYNNFIQGYQLCIRMALRNNPTYHLLDVRNNHFICETGTPVGYNNPAAGWANVTTAIVSDNTIMTASQAAALGYTAPNWSPPDNTKPTVTASGVNLSSIFTVDIAGTARPSVGVWNTGPWQFTASAPNPGTLVLQSPTTNVLETAGSIDVTVHRADGSAGAASVQYATTNDTATAGVNYTSVSGTLNWSNGDTSDRTITIPIINASTYGNKRFAVGIFSATGASLGVPSYSFITIQGVGSPPVTILPGLSWAASDGEIGAPASSSPPVVSQSTAQADPALAGSAVYRFTNVAGLYRVLVVGNWPDDARNSMFVDFNSQPTSPSNIWDVLTLTSGYEPRYAAWRGTGTFDSPQFPVKTWDLSAGTNVLYLLIREPASFTNVTVELVTSPGPTNAPAPLVLSSSAISGYYRVGQSVPIRITFSTNVTVTGTPVISLNTGASASYQSGSGTPTLTFGYTVGSGQTSSALDYSSTNALTLPGGATIQSASGTDADLSLPVPGAAGSISYAQTIVIDTTDPTVSISAPSVQYVLPGGFVSWTIAYSDVNFSVSTLSASDITLISTGTATASVVVTPSPSAIQTVTLADVSGEGTLAIALASGTGIDLAGNLAPSAGSSAATVVYQPPPPAPLGVRIENATISNAVIR